MAVVYLDFERERAKAFRSANKARRVRPAPPCASDSRRTFMIILALAPLAGLAAPWLAVPTLGEPAGWILAGAGLLACVILLFRLAMQEADNAQRDSSGA